MHRQSNSSFLVCALSIRFQFIQYSWLAWYGEACPVSPAEREESGQDMRRVRVGEKHGTNYKVGQKAEKRKEKGKGSNEAHCSSVALWKHLFRPFCAQHQPQSLTNENNNKLSANSQNAVKTYAPLYSHYSHCDPQAETLRGLWAQWAHYYQ